MALSFATLETNVNEYGGVSIDNEERTNPAWLSYGLKKSFVDGYSKRQPKWGFPIGNTGDSFSELVYVSKYSRLKEDNTKERWFETITRVINGTFSILIDHCEANGIDYDYGSLDEHAEDLYDRAFAFKWLPPGRGLWAMGTKHVHEDGGNSGPLQNCGFQTTEFIATAPKALIEGLVGMAMSGVGVGYCSTGAGTGIVYKPNDKVVKIIVEDSKGGWGNCLGLLVESYLLPDQPTYEFDLSQIRPIGSPISSGGTCPGPGPLRQGIIQLTKILKSREGDTIDSRLINDIMNRVSSVVVSGGVRRTALIHFGSPNDVDFMNLKNWNLPINNERLGSQSWGYLSNNSVVIDGSEADDMVEAMAASIVVNGEPGLSMVRDPLEGRMGRTEDSNAFDDAKWSNPCHEIALGGGHILDESGKVVDSGGEVCTLAEIVLPNQDDQKDFVRSAKAAFLYAKIVTLVETPWRVTNEIMRRNRRVGVGVTGVVDAIHQGIKFDFDEAYDALKAKDASWSSWLCINESVRLTTVKPSGTISSICGTTPGVHYPVASGEFLRTVRFANHDPILKVLEQSGLRVEPDVTSSDTTSVVTFPIIGSNAPSERDVSMREKLALAAEYGRVWADQMVSFTCTFLPEEADQIADMIREAPKVVKGLSFLPLGDGAVYQQAPYQRVTSDEFTKETLGLSPINWDQIYGDGVDTIEESGCLNDHCELPPVP